jgi:hypothetical protein
MHPLKDKIELKVRENTQVLISVVVKALLCGERLERRYISAHCLAARLMGIEVSPTYSDDMLLERVANLLPQLVFFRIVR